MTKEYLDNFMSESRFAVEGILKSLTADDLLSSKGAACGEFALIIMDDLNANCFIYENKSLFDNKRNFVALVSEIETLYSNYPSFEEAIIEKSETIDRIIGYSSKVIENNEI